MKTLILVCLCASACATDVQFGLDAGSGGGSGIADASVIDTAIFPDAAVIPDAAVTTCGNGSVDTGETCDPGSGSPYSCPTTESCLATSNRCLFGTPCNLSCKPCSDEDDSDDGCQAGHSTLWLCALVVVGVITFRRRRS